MVKKIHLTKGKVALVDDDDFDFINQWNWYVKTNPTKNRGNVYYAARQERVAPGKQITIRMHRMIMNAPSGIQVDHINGNGLDNRKCNLRLVTNRENHQNRQHHRSSNFPGVSKHTCGRWQARIYSKGKNIFLGLFEDENDASEAYKWALAMINQNKEIPPLKEKPPTSKYRGVSWASHAKKWRAQIIINKKKINLGYFISEEEAAQSYRDMSKKHGRTPND